MSTRPRFPRRTSCLELRNARSSSAHLSSPPAERCSWTCAATNASCSCSAQSWRELGSPGTIFTRCGPAERDDYVHHVSSLGFPVLILEGTTTTSFSFYYEGATRMMTVVERGDVWAPEDADVVPPGAWVH